MLEALRTDDEADNGMRRAEWSAIDEKITTWGQKYNYLASLPPLIGPRYSLSNDFQTVAFNPNTHKRVMVTLEVEAAEDMEVLAKEENRTLTNWIATAALMELKRRKAD